MTAKHILFIDLLGGISRVAKDCNITRGAVWQWKKNGIPKSQMNYLKTKYPSEYQKIYGTQFNA